MYINLKELKKSEKKSCQSKIALLMFPLLKPAIALLVLIL